MAVVTTTLRATGNNTSLVRASNVVTATLTTASTPNIKVGDTVVIAGSTATTNTFNGTHVVTGVTSTTVYTFAQTGADETATAAGTSGGDYSSMTTWESTEQTDLVTDTDTHELHCYDDWPSGEPNGVDIAGWTVNATYYPAIKAATGHEAWWDGSGIGGGFHISKAPANGCIVDQLTHMAVFNIGLVSTNEQAPLFVTGADLVVYIDGVIAHNTFTGSGNKRGIRYGSGIESGSYTRNTLSVIEGDATGASYRYGFYQHTVATDVGNVDFHNCTAILKQGGIGFETGLVGNFDREEFINCVAYGGTGWGGAGTWRGSASSPSNNASSDTTAPGTSPVHSITTAAFVDYANDNFRPEVGGALFGAGTDLSLTSDIRGETPVKISIGAYDSDGFYRTLRDGTGDYSTMSAWESAMQADLTATGDRAYLECYNDWPSGLSDAVTIAGWTTDATYYATVQAAAGVQTGVIGDGFWMVSSGSTGVVRPQDQYTRIIGIGARNTNAASNQRAIWMDCNDGLLDKCWAEASGYDASAVAILVNSANDVTVRNCIAKSTGTGATGTAFRLTSGSLVLQNTTMIAAGGGDYAYSANNQPAIMQNCVMYGASVADYFTTSSAPTTNTNNATGDATATGTGSITGVVAGDFVDYAGGNLRPEVGGALFGAGTDLSLTSDIRGETPVKISIGAYDSDGFYRTLKTSLGDYSAVASWESAMQADLTVTGDRSYLECYAGTYTEPELYFSGWTTSAIYDVTVAAAAGEGHGGVLNAGVIFNGGSVNNYHISLVNNDIHILFQDLSFQEGATALNGAIEANQNTDNTKINRCIFDGVTGGTYLRGVYGNGAGSATCWVRNCLAVGLSDIGFFNGWNANTFFQNCIAVDCVYGFSQNASSGTLQNCASYGASTYDFDSGVTWALSEYCASGDATAQGTGSITGVVAGDFVDYAGGDYRIDDTSALYGTGTDLTGTFTDDIRGTATRISTSPDIGAYKFDVVTKTLKASLGDYTTMSAWESGEQGDLVALGERAVLECYDEWPSGLTDQVELAGWTTDAISTMTVRAAAGNEHGGVVGDGFVITNSSNSVLYVVSNENDVTFQGITFKVTGTINGNPCFRGGGANNDTFSRCIFWVAGTTGSVAYSKRVAPYTGVTTATNCLFYSSNAIGRGAWVSTIAGTHTYKNCSFINFNQYGIIYDSSSATCTNCVSEGASVADFSGITGGSNNASSDTTAPGTSPVTGVVAGDFVNYAGGDYTPTSSGALAGAGTDLSAFFDDDITGTPR